MYYISTDFGANRSSRFPFRAQTNKQTRLNGRYTAGMGNES